MKDVVARIDRGTPTTREDVIAAFESQRQHDSTYTAGYDDFWPMLADVDDEEELDHQPLWCEGKLIMSDKLVEVRWLIDQPGAVHGKMGQKRGDTQALPPKEAARMCALGYATADLKGPLCQPYVQDRAALDEIMKASAAQHHNPENDPRPNTQPIYSPMRFMR